MKTHTIIDAMTAAQDAGYFDIKRGMTVDEIKSAVDSGKSVKWANDGYDVIKGKNGNYMIVCKQNQSAIGLTWRDGMTLNGKPEDFYIV